MNHRLDAKSSKRKGSSKGPDYSYQLVALYVIFLLSVTLWYIWPRESTKSVDTKRNLQHLTTQNPNAEVFDLGLNEKKK